MVETLLGLTGNGLRKVSGMFGWLAGKSDDNPKKAASISVLTGLLTLVGIRPDYLHSVGNGMVWLGEMFKTF